MKPQDAWQAATDGEKQAAHLYQNTPVYRHVQDFLRATGKGGLGGMAARLFTGKQTKEAVKNLDSLIDKGTLPSMTVHRAGMIPGLNTADSLASLEKMVGQTFTESGFSSTSTDPNVIEKFMSVANRVRMDIDVPSGAHGISLNPSDSGQQTKWGDEQEILLPRGSQYKIKEVSKDKDGRYRVRVGLETTNIPKFGDGGIVTKPTLAIVGEKGPEAIVPLNGVPSKNPRDNPSVPPRSLWGQPLAAGQRGATANQAMADADDGSLPSATPPSAPRGIATPPPPVFSGQPATPPPPSAPGEDFSQVAGQTASAQVGFHGTTIEQPTPVAPNEGKANEENQREQQPKPTVGQKLFREFMPGWARWADLLKNDNEEQKDAISPPKPSPLPPRQESPPPSQPPSMTPRFSPAQPNSMQVGFAGTIQEVPSPAETPAESKPRPRKRKEDKPTVGQKLFREFMPGWARWMDLFKNEKDDDEEEKQGTDDALKAAQDKRPRSRKSKPALSDPPEPEKPSKPAQPPKNTTASDMAASPSPPMATSNAQTGGEPLASPPLPKEELTASPSVPPSSPNAASASAVSPMTGDELSPAQRPAPPVSAEQEPSAVSPLDAASSRPLVSDQVPVPEKTAPAAPPAEFTSEMLRGLDSSKLTFRNGKIVVPSAEASRLGFDMPGGQSPANPSNTTATTEPRKSRVPPPNGNRLSPAVATPPRESSSSPVLSPRPDYAGPDSPTGTLAKPDQPNSTPTVAAPPKAASESMLPTQSNNGQQGAQSKPRRFWSDWARVAPPAPSGSFPATSAGVPQKPGNDPEERPAMPQFAEQDKGPSSIMAPGSAPPAPRFAPAGNLPGSSLPAQGGAGAMAGLGGIGGAGPFREFLDAIREFKDVIKEWKSIVDRQKQGNQAGGASIGQQSPAQRQGPQLPQAPELPGTSRAVPARSPGPWMGGVLRNMR